MQVPYGPLLGLALCLVPLAGCRAKGGGAPMSRVFGCMQRGCPSGSYCDEATGYCAVLACSEGCPRGASCNHANGKCESGVPAAARGHEYQQPYGDAQDGRGRGLWREPPP